MGAPETITLTRPATRATAGLPEPPGVESPQVEIPKKLGAVSLVKEIGKGGMGVVWLGRHEMLNRDVAVKFMLNAVSSDDDPTFATFLEGARAAAALSHKGLNTILNADVVGGVPFIVMEYVEGPTLAHLLGRGAPLPLAATRVLMENSCEAVALLHDQGVIHRDIKPANILLGADGAPVLTDFGLACTRAIATMGEKAEGVAGTPDYMAPEMFDKVISPRSDVYALGVTMYELLTGRMPFEGTFEQIRAAHREVEPPLESIRTIHPALAEVVERALAKNPMFRTKTARHLLHALQEAFAQVDPMLANRAKGEAELSQLVGKWTRRNERGAAGPITPTPEVTSTYYDRLSTIAAKRKSGEGEGEAANPDELGERVPPETRCVRCQAPIGGEPVTGRCPGCLLLVRYSLDTKAYEEMKQAVAPAPRTEARVPTPLMSSTPSPREPKGGLRGLWKRLFGG